MQKFALEEKREGSQKLLKNINFRTRNEVLDLMRVTLIDLRLRRSMKTAIHLALPQSKVNIHGELQ